jgi:hypothetical protein
LSWQFQFLGSIVLSAVQLDDGEALGATNQEGATDAAAVGVLIFALAALLLRQGLPAKIVIFAPRDVKY